MSIWRLLFSFEGRIRRSHWWLARLGVGVALFALLMVLGAVAAALGGGGGSAHSAAGQGSAMMVGLTFFLCLPVIVWIELALAAKRWHDRDKPAVMVLVVLIPFIGGIWTLVECGFMDGTPGPNQYGPSPKGLGQAEVFA